MIIKKIWSVLLDLFFLKKCVGCGEHISFLPDFLCHRCRSSFDEEIETGCFGCGKPYYACRCKPEFLSGKTLITTMPYKNENSVSRDLIISCKRKRNRKVFNELAENMADALRKNGITENFAVTFTPRSPKAVAKCGFDQAELLAKQIAKKTDMPFVRIIECRDTNEEQKFLKMKLRQDNAHKRFFIPKRRVSEVNSASFILVDDVVTSGATLNRCADLLYSSGANEVICLGASRTVGDIHPVATEKYIQTTSEKGE